MTTPGPVLAHDGSHWVWVCPEPGCGAPVARCAWDAPGRRRALCTRDAAWHASGHVLADDCDTYLLGGESLTSAAARRGVSRDALDRLLRCHGLREHLAALTRNERGSA
jgi:hypothetical protein